MSNQMGNEWAPLPIRLIFGVNFLIFGFPKLFTAAGHASVFQLLEGLNVPLPQVVSWAVGLIEFGGSLAILLGFFLPAAAWLNIISTGGLAFQALIIGRLPEPFPGQPLFPDYGISLVLIGGLLALAIGESGKYSIDAIRARRVYRMKPLSVIAKIKPGQEEPLRKLLVEINNNLYDNPYIRFSDDHRTHFARWFIFTTPEVGPRLAFAGTYNGDLESYVEELIRVSPGLDEIWGKCEGYTGKNSFLQFVRKHSIKSPYWFTAFPYETVDSIRNKIGIRQELEQFLDREDVAEYIERPGVKPFLDRLSQISQPSGWVVLDRRIAAIESAIVASLRRVLVPLVLWFVKFYSEIGEPKTYPRVHDIYSNPSKYRQYLQHVQELDDNESHFEQNQLTVLAPIKPSRLRLWRLQFALFGGGYLAGYGYPPGELTGVYTIHFLHWLIIDGGKYGFVMSNYDGSWENYLGDFADKLNFGLDALFNNCVGYPPGGLYRVEAWAEWIRNAQLVCPLYYSAYPKETALHITRDRHISSMIGKNFDRETVEQGLEQL